MSKPVPLVQFESDRVVVTTNNPAEVVRAIAALKSGRKQIAERLAELEVEKQNLRPSRTAAAASPTSPAWASGAATPASPLTSPLPESLTISAKVSPSSTPNSSASPAS